jgi:hypothetical protein
MVTLSGQRCRSTEHGDELFVFMKMQFLVGVGVLDLVFAAQFDQIVCLGIQPGLFEYLGHGQNGDVSFLFLIVNEIDNDFFAANKLSRNMLCVHFPSFQIEYLARDAYEALRQYT